MRIWIPTSNRYAWAAEISAALVARYWPDHPRVDVTHFETRPQLPMGDFYALDLGPQARYGWPAAMLEYLTRHLCDQFVLLTLDDYGLFQPVDAAAVAECEMAMWRDPMVTSCALTWQPGDPKTPYPEDDRFYTLPRWPWSVNTQAGLWRAADLIRILGAIPGNLTPWQTERAASDWFNGVMAPEGHKMISWNLDRPADASGFVDGMEIGKRAWPFAYHNLCHGGQPDPRHRAFLEQEGFTCPG
jgi:hypothetical protein